MSENEEMNIVPNNLSFHIDKNGVFISAVANGDMKLYTDISNILNRHILDVLPFSAAQSTFNGLTECLRTEQPYEFDYILVGEIYHTEMEPTISNEQVIGVWAVVTRK